MLWRVRNWREVTISKSVTALHRIGTPYTPNTTMEFEYEEYKHAVEDYAETKTVSMP